MGNVLENATCLGTQFSPSLSGKWIKNSSWHDHIKIKNQWQSAHLDVPYTRVSKVILVDAFRWKLEVLTCYEDFS